jgi:hypothetical protein
MDDRQFDSLARRLGRRSGRRGAVRGLVGGLAAGGLAIARGRRAAAQGCCYLAAGDPCYDDRQCAANPNNVAYQPMFCADNGFAYDGPFNCCAWAGYQCAFDEGCCGALVCVDNACREPLSTGTAALGDPCTFDGDCSQDFPELGAPICADTGFGAATCCRQAGGSCGGPLSGGENDWVCCGQLTCSGGRCGLG